MDNYYQLLNVDPDASTKTITLAYDKKISKFNNLPFFTQTQINQIKKLKTAIYILSNPELRKKYNNTLREDSPIEDEPPVQDININLETIQEPIINNDDFEPLALNEDSNNNFDEVFNIDNSWMKTTNNNTSLKNKIEGNVISDRIFSLSHLNSRPGYNNDVDIEIRKPSQSRKDRSLDL